MDCVRLRVPQEGPGRRRCPRRRGAPDETVDWLTSYSVDLSLPYDNLGSSDAITQDECYALCAAGTYDTCAYQCNGCFGGHGAPSLRSEESFAQCFQYATNVSRTSTVDWLTSYSVDLSLPYDNLGSSDAITQDECYALCAAGTYDTCAYQCNGCFGGHGAPSLRSEESFAQCFQYATNVSKTSR